MSNYPGARAVMNMWSTHKHLPPTVQIRLFQSGPNGEWMGYSNLTDWTNATFISWKGDEEYGHIVFTVELQDGTLETISEDRIRVARCYGHTLSDFIHFDDGTVAVALYNMDGTLHVMKLAKSQRGAQRISDNWSKKRGSCKCLSV